MLHQGYQSHTAAAHGRHLPTASWFSCRGRILQLSPNPSFVMQRLLGTAWTDRGPGDAPTMNDYTPDFTVSFFQGLLETDDEQRLKEAQRLAATISFWAATQGSNPMHADLLQTHLPGILRLSVQCPYEDIRTTFADLLIDLQSKGVAIPHRRYAGPSRYIPAGYVPVSSTIPEERELFREMFMHDGRVSHMVQMMTSFPDFLSACVDTLHMVLRCDGPLPLDWRAYVAMMAASRFNCSYLVHLQKTQFLGYGGDPKWTEGIQHAPLRIRNLQELNCLLAHRPWAITPNHIKALVRGADSWSMSELAQIVVIMATFHSLACFVWGVGVTPELDDPDGFILSLNGHVGDRGSAENVASPQEPEGWTLKTVEALKTMDEGDGEDADETERFQNFEKVETETDTIATPITQRGRDNTDVSSLFTQPPPAAPTSAPYLCANDPKPHQGWPLEHTDFNTRKDRICRVQDYSWQLNRVYGVADLLDTEFNLAFEMTDNCLGGSVVDTTKFRRAIWFYIHRVFGILHDDYNYSEVNQLLLVPLKQLMKKTVVAPQLVTGADLASGGAGLRSAERIHICLLAVESRKQAVLVNFFLSVSEYVNT